MSYLNPLQFHNAEAPTPLCHGAVDKGQISGRHDVTQRFPLSIVGASSCPLQQPLHHTVEEGAPTMDRQWKPVGDIMPPGIQSCCPELLFPAPALHHKTGLK